MELDKTTPCRWFKNFGQKAPRSWITSFAPLQNQIISPILNQRSRAAVNKVGVFIGPRERDSSVDNYDAAGSVRSGDPGPGSR